MVYGYKINNGNVQYLGASDEQDRLVKALQMANISTDGIEFTDTEPVQINGLYYLSPEDPAYIAAKAKADKDQAIAALDAEYSAAKAELSAAYTDAAMADDSDTMAAIKLELEDLNADYDEQRLALEEE